MKKGWGLSSAALGLGLFLLVCPFAHGETVGAGPDAPGEKPSAHVVAGSHRSDGQSVDIDKKAPFLGNDDIDITHYDVRMDFDGLDNSPVTVQETIEVTCLKDLNFIKLHTGPLSRISSVSDGKENLKFEVIDVPGEAQEIENKQQVLQINLPAQTKAGSKLKLKVTLQTNAYRPSLWHQHRLRNARNWPYMARNWLPSNDSPQDPATFDFEIHVPPNAVAAANGKLEGGDYLNGSGVDDSGHKIFRWNQSKPIPTYGLNVVVGGDGFRPYVGTLNLDKQGNSVPPEKAEQKIPLVYYNDGTLPDHVRESLGAAAYFSNKIGKYPFDKLGFVEAPHFSDMESPSLITVVNPHSDVHEVAHQWFGNTLQFRDWSDFWLSEGFTSYFAGLWDEVRAGINTAELSNDGVLNPSGKAADPMTQWGPTPYNKGAAAVADIRRQLAAQMSLNESDPVARDRFLEVIRDLYQDHQNKPLSSQDLVNWMRGAMAKKLKERYNLDEQRTTKWVEVWKDRWLEGMK